jgi:hypothetical protein
VSDNLKPSDIFEKIWVRGIVDLIWEFLRWRHYLASLIKKTVPTALEEILKPLVKNEPDPHGGAFLTRMRAAEPLTPREQLQHLLYNAPQET